MKLERLLSALAALGLHAFVLWGWKPSGPTMIVSEGPPDNSEVQVELVAAAPAEEVSAPEVPEPPVPPEPMPEPPPPEPPPQPELPPPPPTPEPPPMAEPVPIPEPPPEPPKPKPQPRATVRPVVKPPASRPAGPTTTAATGPTTSGAPSGATGASSSGGAARFKRKVTPIYPASAKQAGLSGRVVVLINLNALGRPIAVRVSQSSGVPAFDDAAIRAAQSSEYYPKTVAGIPVPSEVTAPYRFSLSQAGR